MLQVVPCRAAFSGRPSFKRKLLPGRSAFCALHVPLSFQTQLALRFLPPSRAVKDPLEVEKRLESAVPFPVELLDKALVEQDLDTSWRLLLNFLVWSKQQRDSNEVVSFIRQSPKLFLSECITKERFDLILAFFQHFPWDIELFAVALRGSLKAGQYHEVCELIALRRSLEIPLDAYCYNAHISALRKLGNLAEARRTFDLAIETHNDSLHVYNTMLDAYARAGDVDASVNIWSLIKAAGLKPDSISYVGLMRAWGSHGEFSKVEALFDEMQQEGLKPMPHAFTVLFDCITKAATRVDVSWLIAVAQSMSKQDVSMNKHILSAMINAFSRQSVNSEHIQFVFASVRSFREKESPGDSVYVALLSFCCRCGMPERVVDIWKMIKEDDMVPNGYVYSAILKACSAVKLRRRDIHFISEISQALRADWKRTSTNNAVEWQMRGAFNALLHYYAGINRVEDVMSVYHSMKQDGPKPDLITYNTVLAAHTQSRNVRSAMQKILEDMKAAGVDRDVATYGILLDACSNAVDMDRAVALLEEMQQNGMAPTVECYTAVIDTCVKKQTPEALRLAFDHFTLLRKQALQPTAVTYGCMLLAYRALGDVDGAFELYQEACKCGISPSDHCHNVLITMCTEVGRLDDALDLIKVLVRKHGDIAEDTMNSIIRALSAEFLPRSLVLLRMMEHRDMVPSLETFNCLVVACCRDSNIQLAFNLYKEMMQHRLPVNQEVGSALIQSLSKAGEVLAALRVTNGMFEKAGLRSIDASSINQKWKPRHAPRPSRRKEYIVSSAIPNVLSLGALIMGLAQKGRRNTAMYIFRQICILDNASGILQLTRHLPQVFEMLIELNCSDEKVDWAVEVFVHWAAAARDIRRLSLRREPNFKVPKISLASLAFLHATCKRTPGYESYMWPICEVIQRQKSDSSLIPPTLSRSNRPKRLFADDS